MKTTTVSLIRSWTKVLNANDRFEHTQRNIAKTFVKVIFPRVVDSGVVEVVSKVTSYGYCEHKRRAYPERPCSHSAD